MFDVLRFFYPLGYLLLITPPRAIDLTVTERSRRGELSRQPLFVVMLVELLIRIALLLMAAVALEAVMTKTVYETYLLDWVFSMIAILGACHSLSYYLLLGYLRAVVGLERALRLYRLLRNLCYAAIPGLVAVLPLLLWRWKQEQPPFEDGLVLKAYLFTTGLMVAAGVIEALVMKRKPLGLDDHLSAEQGP
jgi:hypothetical protein